MYVLYIHTYYVGNETKCYIREPVAKYVGSKRIAWEKSQADNGPCTHSYGVKSRKQTIHSRFNIMRLKKYETYFSTARKPVSNKQDMTDKQDLYQILSNFLV